MDLDQTFVRTSGEDPAIDHTRVRALIAAVIGTVLEWYDFVVYGFLAVTISRLFFPPSDDTVALLLTVATFGVGFVMRPVGAVVLGAYADAAGRRRALSVTVLLMALGTGLMGFAPTYADIGWWAPGIIVSARLIQGFSAGGELGGATAFMIEHARENARGLTASWQQACQAGALLFGSLIGAAVTGLLTKTELDSWGWRLPFLLGLLIGPVGFYIRNKIDESPAFVRLGAARAKSPVLQVLRNQGRQVACGFGLTIVWTVCTYFFLIYMPTYASRQLGLQQSSALLANSIALFALLVFVPIFGGLSDRVGRRPFLIVGASGIFVLSYPLIAILSAYPSVSTFLVVQVTMALLMAIYTGPAPAAIAELYPTNVRSTGLSIAYNFAVTLFGGFAPFIATWLIATTGNNLAPAYYVMISAAISSFTLLAMRGTVSEGW